MLVRLIRLGWAVAAIAVMVAASTLSVAAQPVPVRAPRPADPPVPLPREMRAAIDAAADPIGALLAQQGLDRRASAPNAMPVIIGLELTESGGSARFAVEISDPVDVRTFTLTNPNRVVIDMPEVLWRVSKEPPPSGRGLVRSYRYGLFRKGNSRFVVDLNKPAKVEPPQILPPQGGYSFRLVIDLGPTATEDFIASAGWPEAPGQSVPAAPPPPTSSPPVPSARVVVIDAGHGGIDPGTHGRSGLQEKNVVLAVAKELRKALEATGRYKVQLTRDSDVFIPLRERVAIARAAHGDLFVSLHADSNDHREVRGASVYTLSEEASDREAGSLAEKENMSDVIAGVDLSGEPGPVASILIDLAQRDTMNRSVRFAETVVTTLPSATMVRPTTPHRSAGFAVLKAPDVPAVLIELGYLSNENDEKAMGSESWRKRVSNAIARSIDVHFGAASTPVARQASSR